MFCKYCGKEINDNINFCPACGQKLIEDNSNSSTIDSTIPPTSTKASTSTFIQKPHKKKSLIISTGVIFLLVLLVVMLLNIKVCYWLDVDGTTLHKEICFFGTNYEKYDLPQDSEKWDYINWNVKTKNNTISCYAVGKPQESYFVGNVFQIVVYDLGEMPVSTGSGFIINSEGWFITNAHVIEDAYSAKAIFNIPNNNTGESYTYLDILGGTYYNIDRDIFIGKLDNYASIKGYYHEISVNTEYSLGEKTYSIGYPNSSAEMKINDGSITETWSDIYEKLYSGNKYICSSSFIAPGSSGGILVNDNLEVIGITTLGWTDRYDNFISGAAISAFNFVNLLNNTNTKDIESFTKQFHEHEKVFIGVFNEAKNDDTERYEFEDGSVGYEYTWIDESQSSDGTKLSNTRTLLICSDGYMEYKTEYYWENGDYRTIYFYGYYNHQTGFSDFVYEFLYRWSNGDYYEGYCDDINYSSDVSLTLYKIEFDSSYLYDINKGDKEYAKEQFNIIYESLVELMGLFE